MELYNKALRLQIEEKYEESEKILSLIIEENIPLLENNGGLPKSMSTLKYSCNVNIGNVLLKQNKVNEALEKYLEVSYTNMFIKLYFSFFSVFRLQNWMELM